jgi:hypothetical protein
MRNEDYRDMLQALADEKVEFLIVGAYALAAHGYPRATMDIDIWVMPSPQNAEALRGQSAGSVHRCTTLRNRTSKRIARFSKLGLHRDESTLSPPCRESSLRKLSSGR